MVQFFQIYKEIFSSGTERAFQSMFGITPILMNEIYEVSKELDFNLDPLHILWLFSFLKMNLPIDALAAIWKVSYNTFYNHIWIILEQFHEKWNTLHFSLPKYHYKKYFISEYWVTGVIDCTECYINRPSENNQSYYSGYKKRHTLKYTMIISLHTKQIIFLDVLY